MSHMFALRFAKSAAKGLARMPQGIARRMLGELKTIAADPAAYRGDWQPLQGSPFWRLRVGDWRAICDVQRGELVLLVVKVAPRGDAYK
jgi:mRNA interferase RelE/StbE